MVQKRKKITREKVSATRKKKQTLTASDINHYKQLLINKRNEILKNVTEIEDETLKKSRLDATGDLSSMPIHMADLGSDNFELELSLELIDSERKLLREIDYALERVEKGTFGICTGSGKLISKARLEAQPWARYCIEYAQKLEKGLAVEQED